MLMDISYMEYDNYFSDNFNIQGGSKGHVQTARVSVSGHEEEELHRKWGSETRLWQCNCIATGTQRNDNKPCKKSIILQKT